MLNKTRGIVLRAVHYAETSLICDILTEAKGRQSYLINGVRSSKARIKSSLFQPMSIIELVSYDREGAGLFRIKEAQAAFVFSEIPFHLLKGTVGLFAVEVASKAIKEAETNQVLFDFLFNSLAFLDHTKASIANFPIAFLAHLSAHIGFLPLGTWSAETPFFDLKEGVFVERTPVPNPYLLEKDSSFALFQLLELDFEAQHEVKISHSERQILLHKLLEYYQLHIEKFPIINSYKILKEVWNT